MSFVTALFSLILGLLLGFYGRQMYDKLNLVYEEQKERREAKQVGVVRPTGQPIDRNAPIDMTSETGGVLKPTPAAVEELRQVDRARILQENHR